MATPEPATSTGPRRSSAHNAAVSTSGDAERFVIIDGHRYSHIVNPATGMGVEDRASVTVVAPKRRNGRCARDVGLPAATERGLKLIEETPGAAALYRRQTPNGIRTFESSRFKDVPAPAPRTRPRDREDGGVTGLVQALSRGRMSASAMGLAR